jgi:DNA-binding NarL/FixJ family response regulator
MSVSKSPDIRVLIVEDRKIFAEGLVRLLGDQPDVTVVGIADCCDAAVEMAGGLAPRVALVDHQLAGSNGLLVAQRIRSRHPDTMVVMITGSADEFLLASAIEVGCLGVLTKENGTAEVLDAIRGAARGELQVSPAQIARLVPELNRSQHPAGVMLTERQRAILSRLAEGCTNKVVALDLHLSVHTVRNYVQTILKKLGAHSKLEAVSIAIREGLIESPSYRS